METDNKDMLVHILQTHFATPVKSTTFHTKSCLETDFSRIEIHEVIMNITRVFTALLFALQRGTDILSPGPAETLGITFFNCHCSRLFSECFVLPQQQQKQHDKSQFYSEVFGSVAGSCSPLGSDCSAGFRDLWLSRSGPSSLSRDLLAPGS
jgi:hypothetical protein